MGGTHPHILTLNPCPNTCGLSKYDFQQKAGGSKKKSKQLQIQILFGVGKSAEYEYYSILEFHSIQILLGLKKSPEYKYKYYWVSPEYEYEY